MFKAFDQTCFILAECYQSLRSKMIEFDVGEETLPRLVKSLGCYCLDVIGD